MQSSWCVCAAAALAVFASGSAFAAPASAYRGEAKLVSGSSAPRTETIAGVTWSCEGDACTGEAIRRANVDGVVRECKRVAAVLGPVAAYRSGSRELSQGQIRACNKGAPEVQTAAN
jgi:hypothetical protein